MTTTKRIDLRAIRHDIRAAQKAIEATEKPLGADFMARIIEREGVERLAKLEADTAAYLDEKRAEVAALQAELVEAEKVACHRCDGSGNYQAPTSHTRNGGPVCFACGGFGRRRSARRNRGE